MVVTAQVLLVKQRARDIAVALLVLLTVGKNIVPTVEVERRWNL